MRTTVVKVDGLNNIRELDVSLLLQCVHPKISKLWLMVCPSTSIRQKLNITRISLHRILRKDLGIKPYKVQLVQELKPKDMMSFSTQNTDNWLEIAWKFHSKYGRRRREEGTTVPGKRKFIAPVAWKFHSKYGRTEGTTVPGIRKFIATVCEKSFIVDGPKREPSLTVRTLQNIEAVADGVSININSLRLARIEHFTHLFTSNTAKRSRCNF